MEDIFYNILWIDDEHQALRGTKGRAKRQGINLIAFKSLNGGMSELERNYPFYDGVLLDAKFFENEEDTEGSEDTFNVHRAKEQLLKLKKKFEVFILTGQAEAYEDKTFKKAFTKVYRKGSDDEIDRLFTDIKTSAALQQDTQLRHAHKRAFDVCTEKYIGEYAAQDLLNLLKVENASDIDSHFNAVRKIVEDLFSAFHKFGLLPSVFVQPFIALNESSKFLSGKNMKDGHYFIEKGYKHLDETHLPNQISNYLRSVLAVTQTGSHRSELDKFVHDLRTPYLLKSVLFQLMDILTWFKLYVDKQPAINNWELDFNIKSVNENTIEFLTCGTVINIDINKGFAFFKPDVIGENVFIPPHLVTTFSLSEEMPIQVEIEEYTDTRNNELKKRVKRIEL